MENKLKPNEDIVTEISNVRNILNKEQSTDDDDSDSNSNDVQNDENDDEDFDVEDDGVKVKVKVTPFQCEECLMKFTRKGGLVRHLKATHDKYLEYRCSHCDLIFNTWTKLNKHEKFDHKDMERNHVCLDCKQAWKTNQEMLAKGIREIGRRPNRPKRTYQYAFRSKYQLMTHISDVHSKIKPYQCHLCDYRSSQKGNVKSHLKDVHKIYRPYKCIECEIIYDNKLAYTQHRNRTHRSLEKFTCFECNHTFGFRSNFTKHNKTYHNKDKAVAPSELELKPLRRMKLTKAPRLSAAKFVGLENGIRIGRGEQLKHEKNDKAKKPKNDEVLKQEKNDEVIKQEEEIFEITEVNEIGLTEVTIKQENDVSKEKEPYVCSECHFEFIFMADIVQHIKLLHKNYKFFNCSKCDFFCIMESTLKSHINKHSVR